jgi:hypothetical protein
MYVHILFTLAFYKVRVQGFRKNLMAGPAY